eukprot:scaffold836_cov123-Isochrysis_galbana.AAC.8
MMPGDSPLSMLAGTATGSPGLLHSSPKTQKRAAEVALSESVGLPCSRATGSARARTNTSGAPSAALVPVCAAGRRADVSLDTPSLRLQRRCYNSVHARPSTTWLFLFLPL